MIQFQTDKRRLSVLLGEIDGGQLALPNFQRSFVWDADAVRELVVSIASSYPAGNLLFMQGGGSIFEPREVEGAPSLALHPPYLVLDGQQRLTSLYRAFRGVGAHRFFLNVRELLDGFTLDDAVEVYTEGKAGKWSSLDAQIADLMFPLSEVGKFAQWAIQVERAGGSHGGVELAAHTLLEKINDIYVKPIEYYEFPLTVLPSTTPLDAVCSIFETLNRTGVRLGPFDLLTARLFAKQVHLRELWTTARENHPVFIDFDIDPYYLLQLISLWAKRTPIRSAVLELGADDITTYWDRAVVALAGVLDLLRHECGVHTAKWLPYAPMLLPLAGAWPDVQSAKGPEIGERRTRLIRWFWCTTFASRYDNAANTNAAQDLPLLQAWLAGGTAPDIVANFSFDSAAFWTITPRQRALYRATIALLMRGSPLDFHERKKLTASLIADNDIDDHHIFPQNYLKSVQSTVRDDTVLNHTLIDRVTNIRIRDKAPGEYLSEMSAVWGEKQLEAVLASHGLPPERDGPLRSDDFPAFLEWRREFVRRELARVTGGDVR